jgi:putative tricarboxylic transport membrane protein
MFCVLGVYAINQSVVDVWIMIIMGLLGYGLRKLEFETAPIVLGLILAPMLELSVRQALAMSGGEYAIFLTRPISATMLGIGAAILGHALWSAFSRRAGWRAQVGLDE